MYRLQQYWLVHCIWSNGKSVQCSQTYESFQKIMQNGFNVYALFPILVIAKRKMFRQYQERNMLQWFPNLCHASKFTRNILDTEFCKTQKKTKEFIQNIWLERQAILKLECLNSSINEAQLSQWDLYSSNQLIEIIMNLASTCENYDTHIRHDSNEICAVFMPEPRAPTKMRRFYGLKDEEIAFIQIMNNTVKHSDQLMTSFPKGVVGTDEFRKQLQQIKQSRETEFYTPPIDVTLVDWFAQKKEFSIIERLKQIRKVMINMDLAECEGELKDILSETENELIGSITDKLDKLVLIQKEKSLLKLIPQDLVNEDCFPELMQLLSKKNKKADIQDISSSAASSDESWNDSWSSN